MASAMISGKNASEIQVMIKTARREKRQRKIEKRAYEQEKRKKRLSEIQEETRQINEHSSDSVTLSVIISCLYYLTVNDLHYGSLVSLE